jgi:peptide deformylase
MAIRAIRCYPDPVLRRRCAPVERFDADLRRLAADMVETMHAAPGIGLAAPQIGEGVRLMVVDLSLGEDPRQLHVLANPVLVRATGSAVEVEGCLSLPELSEKVERPAMVEVSARDLEGLPVSVTAQDWLARALCHEIDHLDGVLVVDRLRGLRRERMRRRLRRLAAPADQEDAAACGATPGGY